MNKIIKLVLDFLFPIECINCNKHSEFLCAKCFNKIAIRNVKQCPLCNKSQNNDKLCNSCQQYSFLNEIIICASYDNELLQKALHLFKYKYIRDLGAPLSKLLINAYKTDSLDYIVIPTPLHKRRALQRGFNQSELLAKEFSQHFNMVMKTNLIYRIKNIEHQAILNKEQRLQNIKNSFVIKKPHSVKNKNIILIDDVITTGATIIEQAKLLKDSGASKIIAICLAKNSIKK